VAAALETPNIPQLVGRYVLYGAIASGGMATVHFGRLVGPAGFARPVAIKRLHAQFAQDPEFVKMFLDEARLAARIAHPNVVQTLDLVESTNEVFLVMDYVRGLSLASLVRTLRGMGERIPVAVSVGILVGVLEGLHAAHEAKNDMGERLDLVHRDVSPQNVLVGTDGVARLLDFGIAKAAGRVQSTKSGQVKGKVAYMAPEQVQGEPVTRRTDIYAASVILWEVLTGRRLFFGQNDADSLRRVMNDRVQAPSALVPELPHALDRVVMRGLERDASKRYSTAHEMAMELGGCIPPAATPEIGQWVERTAAEELNERASRIAAIERSAAESVSRLTSLAAIPGAGAPDAPTPVGRRPLDTASVSRSNAPTATAASVTSVPLVAELRARRTRRLFLGLATVGAAALVIAGVLLLRSHSEMRAIRPVASASASASAGTVPAPSASEPVVSIDDIPSDPPAGSAASIGKSDTSRTPDGNGATAARPPVVRWVPAVVPPRTPTPPTPPTSQVAPSRPTKPGCDPPYTEDAQGHVHFKPSCL
jgi:serine/threonine-protein kinase